jgi:hypothetical protein
VETFNEKFVDYVVESVQSKIDKWETELVKTDIIDGKTYYMFKIVGDIGAFIISLRLLVVAVKHAAIGGKIAAGGVAIALGGTNASENLVLIQNEPYHKVITNYQNSVKSGMEVGEIKNIE